MDGAVLSLVQLLVAHVTVLPWQADLLGRAHVAGELDGTLVKHTLVMLAAVAPALVCLLTLGADFQLGLADVALRTGGAVLVRVTVL